MSTLSQFGSGIKSIQTGYVGSLFSAGGNQTSLANEDWWRWDITVSPVTDITKCLIFFSGSTTPNIGYGPSYNSGAILSGIPTYRMLNTTTLRFMQVNASTGGTALNYLWGRWQIIEYN